MGVTTTNLSEIRAILEFIKDNPDEWVQGVYANPYGTAFCFAGHAMIRDGYRFDTKQMRFVSPGGEVADPYYTASELLGLSDSQTRALFYSKNTLDDLTTMVEFLEEDPTASLAELRPSPLAFSFS